MKFLALISGGKDSVFNIMECVKAGHELVALGNLYPVEGGELDSYMYQSVGSEAIELIAQALDKPLFRRPIQGKPKDQSLEYSQPTDPQDEVEDLYLLLQDVLAKHPDIKGLSSGAIASTYQKNRVEALCGRLGLTSIALLWNRDQTELLTSMVESGLEAILIKVACYGLDQKHLGKTIKELRDYLVKLSDDYGAHCCGEGGEFESLVLDCPLFKRRINM